MLGREQEAGVCDPPVSTSTLVQGLRRALGIFFWVKPDQMLTGLPASAIPWAN